MTTLNRTERNSAVTTAPARPALLGPNGQALEPSTPQPAADWQPVRTADNVTVWERPRAVPEPAVDAQAEADRIVEDARTEADRITAEARSLAARTMGSADHRAKALLDQAAADTARKEETSQRLDVWMARAVIAGAVGLTATGEYSLARLAHFPWQVAWLLPFVIDIYVIQAFRRHRDILQAIGLTIAANVIYHLAAAGMFGVTTDAKGDHHATWWLIALVASIASVILWRMHVITGPDKPRRGTAKRPESVTPDRPVSAAQQAASGTPTGMESGKPTMPESAPEVAREMARPGATNRATPAATTAAKVTAKVAEPARHERATSRRRAAASSGTRGGTEADRQVAKLVALMKRRGGADKVTAADAISATGAPARTASRRLATAREQYAKSN